MSDLTTKSSLSHPQRRLVELMQTINFGRIEDLRVRAGDPLFDPPPRVVQTLKMGGDTCARPEIACQDFWLKNQIIEMFQAFVRVGDGKVLVIEVKHGLPFLVEVEHSPASRGECCRA